MNEFLWAAVPEQGNSLTLLCYDLYPIIVELGYNNAVLFIQTNIDRSGKLSLSFTNFSKAFYNSSCLDIYLLYSMIPLIGKENFVII